MLCHNRNHNDLNKPIVKSIILDDTDGSFKTTGGIFLVA